MPRAHNTALEQREGRFDAIGTYFPTDILFCAVIHGFVLASVLGKIKVVELGLISHDDIYGLVHISSNDVVYDFLIHFMRIDKMQMPATLTDADDWRFLPPLLRIRSLAADIGFVNFDGARELVTIR